MPDSAIQYADPKDDPSALPPDPNQPLSYGKEDDLSKYTGTPSLENLSAPPELRKIVKEGYQRQAETGEGILRQSDVDKQRRDKAFAATEVGPDSILFKSWDAQEQSRKFSTNPLDAFGSMGSIFGIIGAAFTHAPMQAAMEASASAINAINAGDEKGYERAHEAFKENVDLALKRHKIMEERYHDASSILNDNLNLGLHKMTIAAQISGDKQAAYLAEHGMVKEWYDLQQKRADTALKVKEAADKLTFAGMQDEAYKRSPEAKSGDPLVQMGQYYKTHNIDAPPIQQALFALRLKAIKEHWDEDKFIEEAGKTVQKLTPQHIYGSGSGGTSKTAEIARRAAMYEEDSQSPTHGDHAASYDRAAKEVTKAYSAEKPGAQSKPAEIARRAEAYEKDKNSPTYGNHKASYDRAAEEVQKATAPAMTGNKRDELQGKIDRVSFAESIVDDIDKLLVKHNAIAGLGGTATRPLEVISNMLGSNQTDRKEFQRLVAEMQMLAPRVLLDTNGRPLGQEAGRLNTEIAGLAPGDTGPNTIRAYFEFRKQLKFIKGNLQKRKDGGDSAAPAGSVGGDKWWESPAAGNVKDE